MRHSETEWSDAGRHTSRTDLPLTGAGRAWAAHLAPVLTTAEFSLVLTSPRIRARDTAALAGFADAEVDPNLAEWDYGELEGLTTAQIRGRGAEWSAWTIFTGAVPGGETVEQVAARATAVLDRASAAGGNVLLFAHGHLLRVLTAVALRLDPRAGARFALEPAMVSIIGAEHGEPALLALNRGS